MPTPPPTTPLELRLLKEGELWPPYNYGAIRDGEHVPARRFEQRPGYAVLGAFRDDQLVGCIEVSVCDRDALRQSEEYGGGDIRNGPFFREPIDTDTRFLLLHSLWVRPRHRQTGVADALCEQLAQSGLPAFAEFANGWVCGWFTRAYSPAAYQ